MLHAITVQGSVGQRNPFLMAGLVSGFSLLALSQIVPGLNTLLGGARIGAMDAVVATGTALASLAVNSVSAPPPWVHEKK